MVCFLSPWRLLKYITGGKHHGPKIFKGWVIPAQKPHPHQRGHCPYPGFAIQGQGWVFVFFMSSMFGVYDRLQPQDQPGQVFSLWKKLQSHWHGHAGQGLQLQGSSEFFAGFQAQGRKVAVLKEQIENCLQWMKSAGYAPRTIVLYRQILSRLSDFVLLNSISWERTFCCENLKAFQEHVQVKHAGFVLRGFIHYLHRQGVFGLSDTLWKY